MRAYKLWVLTLLTISFALVMSKGEPALASSKKLCKASLASPAAEALISQARIKAALNSILHQGLGPNAKISAAFDGDTDLLADWQVLDPSLERLLTHVPQLARHEREAYRSSIRKLRPREPQQKLLQHALLLGLFDETAWLELAHATRMGAAEIERLARFMPYYLPELSNDLRERVLEILGQNYSSLSKEVANGNGVPKLDVDLLMKHLIDPAQIFETEIANGRTLEEAYIAYINVVQRFVGHEMRYAPELPLELSKEVQSTLKKNWNYASRQTAAEAPRIYLGGSLVNGKANLLTSDLDGSMNFALPAGVLPALERKLQKRIHSQHPESGFHLSMKENFAFVSIWTDTQPIVIRITREAIEILVYDAAKAREPGGQKRGTTPYRTYRWN